MKVKELRKKLLEFDGDLEVVVQNIDTLGDDFWEVEDAYRRGETYSLSGTMESAVVLK